MKLSYKFTLFACDMGYVTQAIINNFCPLLLVLFNTRLGVSWGELTWLITGNFLIQLFMDLVSTKLPDKIGYRACATMAHLSCVLGLTLFAILPLYLPNKFVALIIPVCIYSLGGGLIETLISPIVEACPTKNKSQAMATLHSFFSWGTILVIVLSTFFLKFFPDKWWLLTILWAILPLLNCILFFFVPLYPLTESGKSMPTLQLFKIPSFWLFMGLIFASGATELAISQWASAFAEAGLNVDKQTGDLLGPCLFAFFSGLAKVIYSLFAKKLNLKVWVFFSGLLCIGSYLLAVFSPVPIISLIGLAATGLGIGMLWPGMFSLAAKDIPEGGTSLFAYLALAGDLGCLSGPEVVGRVSDSLGGNLKIGVLSAIAFPILVVILSMFFFIKKKNNKSIMKEKKD